MRSTRLVKKAMTHVTKKTAIHRILRDEDHNTPDKFRKAAIMATFEDAVQRTHRIIFHATNLMTLFYLALPENAEIPDPDESFIVMTMRVVSEASKGGKQIQHPWFSSMTQFYQANYQTLMQGEPITSRYLLTQVITWQSQTLETAVKNNIIAQYEKRLLQCINSYMNKSATLQGINSNKSLTQDQKKSRRAEFFALIRAVKADIVAKDLVFTAPEQYHTMIVEIRQRFVPQVVKCIKYDVKSNTMSFFRYFLALHKYLNGKFRLLPLREDGIAKNIIIDTRVLRDLFSISLPEKVNNVKVDPKPIVWPQVFNMKRKEFKMKHHTFNHTMTTDGVSVSLHFKSLKGKVASVEEDSEVTLEYNHYVAPSKEAMKGRTVVAIDPNKEDLLYCVGRPKKDNPNTPEDFNHLETFRFTKVQKNVETGARKLRKIRIKAKSNKVMTPEGWTRVGDLEARLSRFTTKTADPAVFQAYLAAKIPISWDLKAYYSEPLHRDHRWHTFINTQRCEAKLINRFKKKYGDQDRVVVCFGDYDQGHLKGCEPVKGKAYRKLFHRNGFDVRLVDEFRTSKMCHCCHHELDKYYYHRSKRPGKNYHKYVKVHGLLRCQTCPVFRSTATSDSDPDIGYRVWNRDLNAAKNIYRVATSILGGEVRPAYLSRGGVTREGLSTLKTKPLSLKWRLCERKLILQTEMTPLNA